MFARHSLSSGFRCRLPSVLTWSALAIVALPDLAHGDVIVPPGELGTQTWTAAAGPYFIGADVRIPAGARLTIEAGTEIIVSDNDAGATGASRTVVEFVIDGELISQGTMSAPVHIWSSGGPSSWNGILITRAAVSVELTHTIIEDGHFGLRTEAPGNVVRLDHVTIRRSEYGLYLLAGSPRIEAPLISECMTGILVDRATVTIENGIIYNCTLGAQVRSGRLLARNCTLDRNGAGFQNSSDITQSLRIENTIVSRTRNTGVWSRTASATVVVRGLFWMNGLDTSNIDGVSTISNGEPRFAAPNLANYRLQGASRPPSVAIDAALDEYAPIFDFDGVTRPHGARSDIGAFEFVAGGTCGNGIREGIEGCDDGAENGTYGACNAECSGVGLRCGDGRLDGPEECDDGNTSGGDRCSNRCRIEMPSLDAGVPDAGQGIPDSGALRADSGMEDAGIPEDAEVTTDVDAGSRPTIDAGFLDAGASSTRDAEIVGALDVGMRPSDASIASHDADQDRDGGAEDSSLVPAPMSTCNCRVVGSSLNRPLGPWFILLAAYAFTLRRRLHRAR